MSFRPPANPDIRTKQLFKMSVRDVIDATPPDWRQQEGRLWRGSSVAAIALKLAKGDYTLNPRKTPGRGRGFNASYSYDEAGGMPLRVLTGANSGPQTEKIWRKSRARLCRKIS